MKVRYIGFYQIKFASVGGFSGVLQHNDVFEMPDEMYNSQYKDNQCYEPVKAKKIKEDK